VPPNDCSKYSINYAAGRGSVAELNFIEVRMRTLMLRARRSAKVGAGAYWIKSSLSFSNGDCVEVTGLPDGSIGVRDSKDIRGPVLRFTPAEWDAFLGGVRNGEFDRFGKS
jgi:hypothetical protein